MHRRSRPFVLPIAPLLAALFMLALAAPAAFAASGEEAVLTPELEALATPGVAEAPPAAQSEAAGLPSEGAGSLLRDGERVIVEAQFEGTAPEQVEALKAAGAKVRVASGRLKTVAIAIDPADLDTIAALPGITAITPALAPVLHGLEEPTSAVSPGEICEGGSVISQGVAQLNVPAARAAFGVRGAGQTVGVISDSYDSATKSISPSEPIATHAQADVATDDLPGIGNGCPGQATPVRVIAEAPAPEPGGRELTDEGRAMLQVVHDVAPEAQLAFATAEGGELEFARNIELLAAPVSAGGAGADVIVDDISYLSEPAFQDGPVAAAIAKVTAAGVTYLTAAGNDNTLQGKKEIGSFEAPAFRSVACPTVVQEVIAEAPGECMNFNPSSGPKDVTYGMEVAAHSSVIVDLQWAEARFGVSTDLDTYLFDAQGDLLDASNLNNIGLGQPVELAHYENETNKGMEVLLVITRRPTPGTGSPRLKFTLLGGGVTRVETAYSESREGDVVGPTIYGHAGAAAAITLAAVKYTQSATAPMAPETYSSRGPVTHYFGPVTGALPAAPLAAPEVIAKPNLTATDCASTTFFATLESGSWHFCGTSEAAPHAAGVAALMRQLNPVATPAAVGGAMGATATKFTSTNSPNAVGAGMLNALGALTALGPAPPPVVEPTPVVTITRGPALRGRANRPTFEFTSSVAATFTCVIDAAPAVPCASPFVFPAALKDGGHSFSVIARNAQGASGSSAAYGFVVDTKAPTAAIAKHPKKLVTTRKKFYVGRFKLKASEAPVTFLCQVDKAKARTCGQSFHRRFGKGLHTVKVKARDAAGNLGRKWTTYEFRVKQLRPRAPRRAGHRHRHRSA
jgi:subtilisin family serine protease